MESYLFDGQGAVPANGKKGAFHEAIRKRIGTIELFGAAIFSNQKRSGNFLGLERSANTCLLLSSSVSKGCG
jgi:hypothetical protein